MKPIETFYKGYKFRSRLEARWAVFFDCLNLKWQYEVEGFNLSDGRKYLPDFKINTLGKFTTWYEIKPLGDPGDGKMQQFSNDFSSPDYPDLPINNNYKDGNHFMVLSGDPYEVLVESDMNICPRCGNILNEKFSGPWNDDYHIYCWTCDIDTPGGSGNPPEKCLLDFISVVPYKGDLNIDSISYDHHKWFIQSFCETARSSRFEFGETRR